MSITAGVAPDLVHLDGDMVNDFALRNALIPINLEKIKTPRKNFYENYLKILEVNNKQMAMPLMPTAEALHINKTILDKYNLAEPETLNDLVKDIRRDYD